MKIKPIPLETPFTVNDIVNSKAQIPEDLKVRQIDIGMETSITINTKLQSINIRKDSKECIGLAWENFDVNLKTLSGAGSIHHTYGVCYQNVSVHEEEGAIVDNSNDANKEYTEAYTSVTVNNRKRKITEISNKSTQ